MKAKQLRNGEESEFSKDYVYEWIVTPEDNESRADILNWCKSNLMESSKDMIDYMIYLRNNDSYEELTKAISEGYYMLYNNLDNTYTYKVKAGKRRSDNKQ